MLLANCTQRETLVTVQSGYDFLLHLDEASIEGNSAFVYPECASMPKNGKEDVSFWGIFQHAPSRILFQDVFVGDNGFMDFSIGVLPAAWKNDGDGVRFEIRMKEDGKEWESIFTKYIDPKINPEERKWLREKISLSNIHNSTVSFEWITHPGVDDASNDNGSDWAVWGHPKLFSDGRLESQRQNKETNFILITLDTCRADYLHCYGNSWIETPNLDQLASEGILFERAFSASSTTTPSHVSIYTSMQPFQHGVLTNGYVLGEAVPRLTQFMVERGYKTGASISVYHLIDEFSGLGKWFDDYNHLSRKWSEKSGGFNRLTRGGAATTNAAIEWMDRVHDEPFFLWVHYYDSHAPYTAEGEFHQKYYLGDPKSLEHRSMERAVFQEAASKESLAWIEPYRDLEYFKREYGAEIAFVDSQIGRLLEALKRLRIEENTAIVVTADHGENLGERDIYFDHWTLFDTDIHVPLIVWFPRQLPRGLRIDAPVAHIDIAPTILDILGEDGNPMANAAFDGESLRPYWDNPQERKERIVTSHGLLYTEIAGMDGRYKVIWELRDALYHDRFNLKMDRVSIYDRKSDPEELSPIAVFYWGDRAERQSFAQKMREAVLSIQDEDKNRLEEKQLYTKLFWIRPWIANKVVPTQEELTTWLQEGTDGIPLAGGYLQDPEFIPSISRILIRLKEEVNPPSLEERLKDVIDSRVLADSQIFSSPSTDENIKEFLRSLGYR